MKQYQQVTDRIVAILHMELWKIRAVTVQQRGIDLLEFRLQDAAGPTIDQQVGHRHREYPLVPAEICDEDAEERPCRKIEMPIVLAKQGDAKLFVALNRRQ